MNGQEKIPNVWLKLAAGTSTGISNIRDVQKLFNNGLNRLESVFLIFLTYLDFQCPIQDGSNYKERFFKILKQTWY